jgi:hypothetical protein
LNTLRNEVLTEAKIREKESKIQGEKQKYPTTPVI